MPKICYLIVPDGLATDALALAAESESRFGWRLEILQGVDWNNDMTPWEAPGVFKAKKPFLGNSESYLPKLEQLILERERNEGLELKPSDRALMGISLSGLFALWAGHKSGLFGTIFTISGSFWYDGFADWVERNQLSAAANQVYISLGAREAGAKDPRMASVQVQTERIVDRLKAQREAVVYSLEAGITHFSPIVPRIEKALASF